MLQNLSLRARLAITVLLIGIIVGGVNIYQIVSVEHVNTLSQQLINSDVQGLNALQSVGMNNAALRDAVADYRIATVDHKDNKALQQAITDKMSQLQQAAEAYHSIASNEKDTPTQELTDLNSGLGTVTQQAQSVLSKPTETNFGNSKQASSQLDAVINKLTVHEQTAITDKKDEVSSAIKRVKLMFVLMTAGVTAASILICIVLMRSIARSLARIKKYAQRIANGDFSVPLIVTGNDELGQLGQTFNTMSERLRDSYRRLAIEQQRDEAILQGMGEGLIATDEKGQILLLNHIAAEFFDIADQKTVIGKPIHEIYAIHDEFDNGEVVMPYEQRPIYEALTSGKPVNGTYAYYKANKQRSLIAITATPIMLDDKVVGAISIIRDVTKEKEVDRMKTEFISLASHQLRTPLSAIKWFTEMLVSGDAGELSPEQLEFAKNIDDSTERMIALVNALLNISRIESGRIVIDPKPTDLHELVGGIVNDLRAKTEERQQSLLISVHQDLPKINLDPRLIGQVYLNLLTNAIKYTPKGGEITVFVSRKDDQIISQITDNGYGIPKEQQGRLFEKFFRASNAVKVETDGTGLGLYLIKAVVESSGGKIWFESEEGKGSTFWFSIPVSGMKAKAGEVTLDV